MGAKDTSKKMRRARNDVLAGIISALMCCGRQVIKPRDLLNETTASSCTIPKKIHRWERDAAEFRKPGKIRPALIGRKNRTDIDRMMQTGTLARALAGQGWSS